MANTFKVGSPIVVGTLTADPGTAENGTMYYNSTSGVFRVYQSGVWGNSSSSSLNNQNIFVGNGSNVPTAVDTSSTGDILADSTGGLTIKAGAITDSEVNGSAAIALTKLAALTNHNRALISDNSGFIIESAVTTTELGYVSGVTSAIQTQLNGKLNLSGGTMSGNIAMGGNKLTGLGAGSGAGDSVRYEQAILTSGVNDFAANQSMGGNKLTNLANGTASGDAVNYSQLTSLGVGLVWQDPVNDPDLVDDSLSTPPITPVYSITYIIGASPTGAWTGLAGYAVWWDGTQWIDLSTGNLATIGLGTAVQVGDRFAVAIATPGAAAHIGGGLTGKANNIAVVTANTPGSFAYTFVSPVNNYAVSVVNDGSQHYGFSYTYNASGSAWVNFSGPSKNIAGNALAYSGNTLNVLFDGVTLDLTGNSLEVKAGGISNTQIGASAAIALSKLAALTTSRALQSNASTGFIEVSAVTNTELGYVSGVTSAIQTQLGGKANTALSNLAAVAINTSLLPGSDLAINAGSASLRFTNVFGTVIDAGASDLTLKANAGSNAVQMISNAMKRGASSSRFVNELYSDSITLTGGQTGTAVAAFTVAFGTIDCEEITYRIKDGTSNAIRVGTLRAVTDGTNTSITDTFTETSDAGVTWTAAINGSNLEIRYTTTANNKTMRADIKQFLL